MGDIDEADLNLTIPLTALAAEFDCPICFSAVDNCYMTPCGHNFCEECIRECINREHICPCCRAPCTRDQLVHNHHFDSVLSIIKTEKDEASRKYFENLIAMPPESQFGPSPSSGEANRGFPGTNEGARELSAIERLFQKHMRGALSAYEQHYDSLRRKYEVSVARERQNTAAEMANIRAIKQTRIRQLEMSGDTDTANTVKIELEEALTRLNEDTEARSAELLAKFEQSVQTLLDSYDRYLETSTPMPSFLPINVTIRVPDRDVSLPNIPIESNTTAEDIKVLMVQALVAEGVKVSALADDGYFVLHVPFADDDNGDGDSEGAKSAGKAAAAEGEPLTDPSKSIHSRLQPNSVIEYVGGMELESDVCFSAVFEKESGQKMDYATCRDCGFNWICTACADSCHAGHNLVPYLKAHEPTWACCYCVKKGKCKLENIKTKKAKAKAAAGAAS